MDRESEIASGLREGKTYAELGASFGISRQRVHQIAKRIGIAGAQVEKQRAVAAKRIEERDAARKARVAEWTIRRSAACYCISVDLARELSVNGAIRAYQVQRSMAQQRAIDWQFTLGSWWEVWRTSGKWEQRGRASGNYVMSRFRDSGPYSPSNVRIATFRENAQEAAAIRLQRFGNYFTMPPATERIRARVARP